MLNDPALGRIAQIRHGFFTRTGGASGGIYKSLNCGFQSKDDANSVAVNRERAMARFGLGAEALITMYQVHGSDVLVVGNGETQDTQVRADGVVTRCAGVALGILTADCAPVLFADKDNNVIGAAHAGWRGAQCGVLEATIAAMENLGAARESMIGAIGPCIGGSSYEVGPEFPAPFLADDLHHDRYFGPSERDGFFMFDLEAYISHRLSRAGLGAVTALGYDTCAEEDRFFSYRRATHRGEPDYGRQLSAITLLG
jgi:YfiH family protein